METMQAVGIGAFILGFIAISIAWFSYRKSCVLRGELGQQIESLQQQIELVNRGAVGVGRRLIRVEKNLQASNQMHDDFVDPDDGYLPYTQAMTLLDQGADKQQLVDQCGLSEAEAHLMEIIHNPSQASLAKFK